MLNYLLTRLFRSFVVEQCDLEPVREELKEDTSYLKKIFPFLNKKPANSSGKSTNQEAAKAAVKCSKTGEHIGAIMVRVIIFHLADS